MVTIEYIVDEPSAASYKVDMAKMYVGLRIEEALLARVDALAPRLSTPYLKPRRSDLLRALLLAGLEAIEATAPVEPPSLKRATFFPARRRRP